jgi:tetratricopeptide (TPR) repeat protein
MNCKHIGIVLLAGITSACASNNHTVNNSTHVSADEVAHPDAPLTADTRFAAGQLAESQGDMPRAITQYQEAVKLDPKASAPLLRLGMIYTNQQQFDEAVSTWNRYIKVTGGAAAGYCDLGYTLELAGRSSEAELAYRTAIAKDPKNETAQVNYGLMLERAGRTDEAITQLQTVLTPAEVHYNLASVLESQGKISAAKAEYKQAIQLDPEMYDAKVRLTALDTN